LRQNVGVADWNLRRRLRVQLVDVQRFLVFVIVVESGFNTGEDVVGLETDHVVQESTEFVNL
jgi:hypothetical protein